MAAFLSDIKRNSGVADYDDESSTGEARIEPLSTGNNFEAQTQNVMSLEDIEIGYNARYASVRQSAFLSVIFMVGYLALGTAFLYDKRNGRYGNHRIPKTPGFQLYVIFYILIGMESLYFSFVSLTTVGFGDYFPTRTASIWFCIFWLPFLIGFMSLFRIERQMKRRLERAKRLADMERVEALRRAYRGQEKEILAAASGEPVESNALGPGDSKPPTIPRHHVKRLVQLDQPEGFDLLRRAESWKMLRIGNLTWQSMRDIVRAVRRNLSVTSQGSLFQQSTQDSIYMSTAGDVNSTFSYGSS